MWDNMITRILFERKEERDVSLPNASGDDPE